MVVKMLCKRVADACYRGIVGISNSRTKHRLLSWKAS